MERQLTEGRPFGVLLRYALPVLGGNLFQLFYTLADTVIVGKTLGADALRRASSPVRGAGFVIRNPMPPLTGEVAKPKVLTEGLRRPL